MEPDEIARFESGAFPASQFSHGEHVRFGRMFLETTDFAEALRRFSGGLKLIAQNAGKSDIYNETITTAFLSLIAEAMLATPGLTYDGFCRVNPHLLDPKALSRFYSPGRLHSQSARATFLLPDLLRD